jgi:hypothetical protein
MSLEGVLSDFGVADIFQLISQQRKTGILSVERKDRTLEVLFSDGGVLRALPAESRPDASLAALLLQAGVVSEKDLAEAWRKQEETLESLPRVLVTSKRVERQVIDEARRLLTDETIFELFLWDEGRFSFRPCDVERTDTDAPVGAEMVLLDALRMRDEWAQIKGKLLNLSVVVAPTIDIVAFRERRAEIERSTGLSSSDLERVFRLVDGRLSARRVIDLARLGTFNGGRALVGMLKEEVIRLETLSEAAGPTLSAKAPSNHSLLGYAVLALCWALAVLLLQLPGPGAATDFPIITHGLREAEEAASAERLRVLLESHRWTNGAYPESLEHLQASQEVGLAPLPVDRYSYSRSGEGYTLRRK